MRSIEELAKILEEKKPYLREKYGVTSLNIFGSYSRNEATSESDLDILVEFEKPIGLEFVDLADELEAILGVPVDLVSRNGVKPKYLKQIQQDLIHV